MHVCVGPQLYLFCSHHLSWRTFMDTLASFYTRTDAGTGQHCVGSIHARRHYRGDTRVGHAGLVQLHLYIHIYQYMRALNISSRALLLSHPLFLLCKTLILHIPPV